MILAQIEIYNQNSDELLDIDPKTVVAMSLGEALNHIATNPPEGASFRVTVVQKDIEVI